MCKTVVLKPGRCVVLGGGGNKPIEVKTGQWIDIESVTLLTARRTVVSRGRSPKPESLRNRR
jgi:hypothetical protein